jgi:hypothetical protein
MQYQSDITQSGSTRGNTNRDGVLDGLGNPVTGIDAILTEAHIAYRSGAWGFRALFAEWNIDDKIETVANNDSSNNGLGRDRQYGYYLEPSFQLTDKFGLFARYERTDERAGSKFGDARDSASKRTLLGMNYWLTDNVIMKLDYQFEDDDKASDLDGFNLGVGWQF